MRSYPETIEETIMFLKQLPGVGRRGAERLTLAMLAWENNELLEFAAAIRNLAEKITPCPECGNYTENHTLCEICSDPRRDISQLCIVENVSQLSAMEKGGNYRGRYLVLGGKLSPLDGETGENLNIPLLLERAALPEVKEVIFALSSDVEGRATTGYLAELLREHDISLSQLAQGLPAGANLSYADGATVAVAFNARVPLK